jgi:hypothetical protein
VGGGQRSTVGAGPQPQPQRRAKHCTKKAQNCTGYGLRSSHGAVARPRGRQFHQPRAAERAAEKDASRRLRPTSPMFLEQRSARRARAVELGGGALAQQRDTKCVPAPVGRPLSAQRSGCCLLGAGAAQRSAGPHPACGAQVGSGARAGDARHGIRHSICFVAHYGAARRADAALQRSCTRRAANPGGARRAAPPAATPRPPGPARCVSTCGHGAAGTMPAGPN